MCDATLMPPRNILGISAAGSHGWLIEHLEFSKQKSCASLKDFLLNHPPPKILDGVSEVGRIKLSQKGKCYRKRYRQSNHLPNPFLDGHVTRVTFHFKYYSTSQIRIQPYSAFFHCRSAPHHEAQKANMVLWSRLTSCLHIQGPPLFNSTVFLSLPCFPSRVGWTH